MSASIIIFWPCGAAFPTKNDFFFLFSYYCILLQWSVLLTVTEKWHFEKKKQFPIKIPQKKYWRGIKSNLCSLPENQDSYNTHTTPRKNLHSFSPEKKIAWQLCKKNPTILLLLVYGELWGSERSKSKRIRCKLVTQGFFAPVSSTLQTFPAFSSSPGYKRKRLRTNWEALNKH